MALQVAPSTNAVNLRFRVRVGKKIGCEMCAKARKTRSKRQSVVKRKPLEAIELVPDAMERFERAVSVMAPARRKRGTKK